MIYPSTPNDRLIFRPLRADEIEVRPCDTTNGKVKLLLYKNARVDMNILDETVGTLNWQKDYFEERGLLFCKVGIRHPKTGEWIWKADTGSESNIEAEKGLASDSFKRAAFAFGIGRELYTAPRIVFNQEEKDLYNGNFSQTFKVGDLQIENGVITRLTVLDKWDKVRFSFPNSATSVREDPSPRLPTTSPTPTQDKGGMSKNEIILYTFYESKKDVFTGDDKRELDRLYKWGTSTDKNNPSQKNIDRWDKLMTDKLWSWWLSKAK